MKRLFTTALPLALAVILAVTLFTCPQILCGRDGLFQVSTMDSLLKGGYTGFVDVRTLKGKGDFGIGTFDGLDGEMVVIDRKCYQVSADGVVREAAGSATTPFAMVTVFKADTVRPIKGPIDLVALTKLLDTMATAKDAPYAIRVEGVFDRVRVRSVPKQGKPYPTLAEALKSQTVFDLTNVEGTIVGFRMPGYMNGVNLPGYHFHFITKDRREGGHLLQCTVRSAVANLQGLRRFGMVLPKKE